jgi:hypothetical protein
MPASGPRLRHSLAVGSNRRKRAGLGDRTDESHDGTAETDDDSVRDQNDYAPRGIPKPILWKESVPSTEGARNSHTEAPKGIDFEDIRRACGDVYKKLESTLKDLELEDIKRACREACKTLARSLEHLKELKYEDIRRPCVAAYRRSIETSLKTLGNLKYDDIRRASNVSTILMRLWPSTLN